MHFAVTGGANEELSRDAVPWALQGQPCSSSTSDLESGLWSPAVSKEGGPGKVARFIVVYAVQKLVAPEAQAPGASKQIAGWVVLQRRARCKAQR